MQRRKAACERFIEDAGSLGETTESIGVNQISRESAERRGGVHYRPSCEEVSKRTSQERRVGKELQEEGATKAKEQDIPKRFWKGTT